MRERVGEWVGIILVLALIVLGAATALAFVVLPLFSMPYPSNLKGAAVGLGILIVVFGVLKFICGGTIEILIALGIFGALAAMLYPSVRAQRDRERKSANTSVSAVSFIQRNSSP